MQRGVLQAGEPPEGEVVGLRWECPRLVDAGWEAARWADREGVTVALVHQLTQVAPRLRGWVVSEP